MGDLPREMFTPEMHILFNWGKAYFTMAKPISLGYATHSREVMAICPWHLTAAFLNHPF
jgi:hypothetical protein